jgi:hypothetical protein
LFETENIQATQWTQTAILSAQSAFYLGGTDVEMYDNLILADYCTANTATCLEPNSKVLLFEEVDGHWDARQTLGYKTPGDFSPTDYSVSSFAVYEDTIVLGYSGYDITYLAPLTNVGAVYVLEPGLRKGKPQPRQWSIQQVLFSDVPAANGLFGKDVSIDGNTLLVSGGATPALYYIFERTTEHGKWSLQQKLTGVGALNAIELRGNAFVSQTAGANTYYYHRTTNWDCLLFELSDHFDDGWDTAQLIIETPHGVETLHGDVDNFEPRCDLPNPITFRYCPKDVGDVGKYRVSVKNGLTAKFRWEILWRVFEERSGLWHIGKWDTVFDMDWTKKKQMEINFYEKVLPTNVTCEKCPSKPTEKPTPAFRRVLKGNDDQHTHSPTVSQAPTLSVTNIIPWRKMTLTTSGGNPWFDQHKSASYYVSDAEGHHLIHVGTMCPGQTNTVDCWVDLPDGSYIVRIGGHLQTNKALFKWSYCKTVKTLSAETQMVIEIANDDCRILSHHTSVAFCQYALHYDATVIVDVQLLILGAATSSSSLSANDALVLQEALISVIPGLAMSDVKIQSIINVDGKGVVVVAQIFLSSIKTGVNFAEYDGYAALQNIHSYLQGDGAGMLRIALLSGSHANSFSSSTSVTVLAFDVMDSVDIPLTSELPAFGALDYVETPTRDYLDEETASPYSDLIMPVINGIAEMGYLITGIVVFLMGILVASRIAKQQKLKKTKKVLEIHSNESSHSSTMEVAMVYDNESPKIPQDDDAASDVSDQEGNQGSTLKIVKKKSKSATKVQ